MFYRIAADLNLKSYVHHYWRDFPTACRMDMEHAKTYQITPEILNEISQNLSDEPPNIVKTLHTLLDSKKLPEPFPIIDEVKLFQVISLQFFKLLNLPLILEFSAIASTGQ